MTRKSQNTPVFLGATSQGHRRAQFGDRVELQTCMDLIDRGYAPFRSVCQHAPFDVIAVSPTNELFRVECRTGQYYVAGDKLSWGKKGADVTDWFAVWHPVTGAILYFDARGAPVDP